MLRAILGSICLASCSVALAKGAHSSGPVEHVAGYTKANGTQVAPYDRAAPGYGVHGNGSTVGYSSDGMAGGNGPALDDPMSFAGVGKQDTGSATSGPCVYKAVMSDTEIATCRAAQNADATKSARRRK